MDPPRPDEPTAPPPPAAPPPVPRRPVTIPQYLWVVGAAIVVILALHFLGAVLTPFLVGAIFAYLGTPLVDAMHRRGIGRTAGTTATVLLFGVVVIAVLLVLVPLVQAELSVAMKKLPDLAARLVANVSPWVEENLGFTIALDMQTLRDFLAEHEESAKALTARVLAGIKAGSQIALALIINAALIPVVMFYLLRDWHVLWARLFDLVPRRWRAKTVLITGQIDRVLAEFLRGQGLVMVSLALYYIVGLSIAGLQYALPIGILTGMLVFIPYVGFGTGFVLGMLAALLQWSGPWPFLAILSVYGIGQILENYVLVPWLIGDRIGLHPLAVIFALLAFGTLFGFAGVLLALPASAALLVGLRHLRSAYSESALYGDDPEDE